ncbi:DNA-processing protein DprA [Octadecabacter sp. 1_MG-2023]|uniref:DNA-processing protein DprA n=1 Tax=unclassified Octadecabacter TaxID=196158 RepID=UPI001C099162|nr:MULTISPECIES: DNA-processing protein DprA [unclassified Octadecabacter]MBU2992015.1 DNA-processing protein DprA [Octadecabacter sp. B2R22]MDO6735990.1 DNA-processing protein DprA [Octadecabacter sp. 1_MG-2023]
MTEDETSSTHPPLPPTTEDDRLDRLRLLRSRRVGPATYRRLLREHGSAGAALAALPEIANSAGVSDYRPCPEGVAIAELKAGRAAKARLVFEGDADFPTALSEIDDAPVMLWMMGQTAVMSRPMIALVGARNASSLGTRMARKLAAELGEAGFTVVSGLARGIDAVAHDAALSSGTVAVVAGGVDVIYPAENAALAHRIAKDGLRISDQPIGQHPMARHFVARNRIISGVSMATLVVEAAAKSGSLITARTALDQGRDVLAVPGHPFDARASGCNMLIRDGATLVRGASDVLEFMGDPKEAAPELPLQHAQQNGPQTEPSTRNLRETALLHQDILSRLGPNPMAEDQLLRMLNAAPTAVAPILMDLELDGKVVRQAGGLLARAN